MDTTPSNVATTTENEPRDLLARLYREIGISAVAAALELASVHDDTETPRVSKMSALADKAA